VTSSVAALPGPRPVPRSGATRAIVTRSPGCRTGTRPAPAPEPPFGCAPATAGCRSGEAAYTIWQRSRQCYGNHGRGARDAARAGRQLVPLPAKGSPGGTSDVSCDLHLHWAACTVQMIVSLLCPESRKSAVTQGGLFRWGCDTAAAWDLPPPAARGWATWRAITGFSSASRARTRAGVRPWAGNRSLCGHLPVCLLCPRWPAPVNV